MIVEFLKVLLKQMFHLSHGEFHIWSAGFNVENDLKSQGREIERLSGLLNWASDVMGDQDVTSEFTDQLVVLATLQSMFVFMNSRTGLWSEWMSRRSPHLILICAFNAGSHCQHKLNIFF